MCSCMIRQRSSAGSEYHARVLTNGYTNRYLPWAGRTSRRDSSEYSEGLVMARNEYGVAHHFINPLWASTTWNSWIRSRFWAWVRSIRSASPRVPTSEKARSRWPSAKSSQAAMNSRLSAARRSSSRRRQAGSTRRKVYLTKCRTGIDLMIRGADLSAAGEATITIDRHADRASIPLLMDVSGGRDKAPRGSDRILHGQGA